MKKPLAIKKKSDIISTARTHAFVPQKQFSRFFPVGRRMSGAVLDVDVFTFLYTTNGSMQKNQSFDTEERLE